MILNLIVCIKRALGAEILPETIFTVQSNIIFVDLFNIAKDKSKLCANDVEIQKIALYPVQTDLSSFNSHGTNFVSSDSIFIVSPAYSRSTYRDYYLSSCVVLRRPCHTLPYLQLLLHHWMDINQTFIDSSFWSYIFLLMSVYCSLVTWEK